MLADCSLLEDVSIRVLTRSTRIAGSRRFALSLLQTQLSESDLNEELSTSRTETTDNEDVKATEHLWQTASEKSTLHSLVIRSLSEARQRNEPQNDQHETDCEPESRSSDERGTYGLGSRHSDVASKQIHEEAAFLL